MNLFDAVEKVKNALSSKDFIASLTHFHLKGGEIHAANGAMSASCPVDELLEHVVPADELTKAMSILGKEAQYLWGEEELLVKKGRRKITIRLLKPETIHLQEPVERKIEVPQDFIQRMKLIRPFLSDDASKPWALTAWLHQVQNKLVWTATNNMSVVEVDMTLASAISYELLDIDCQIPNFALDFLIQRGEGLKYIGVTEKKVTFFFHDGSKMTTQLFVQKMPEQVSTILHGVDDNGEGFTLTPEWREAYNSIIQLSPDEIVMGATSMIARRRQATMEIEVETPVPQDDAYKTSYWSPKFLTPVVGIADIIDFASYPKPAKFYGVGIRGLTVGKLM